MNALTDIMLGLIPLIAAMIAAGVLMILRDPSQSQAADRLRLQRLFLIAIACQCLHVIEEFTTGFHEGWPLFLGLDPWPPEFFIAFNLCWMAIWMVCAVGIIRPFHITYFPVWFFAIGMTVNGVGHPALALIERGYFPGLVTSPIVGVFGVVLLRCLWRVTGARNR